ncbi:MAG: 1-deoxy-D-xylulose-5-phosphate synthase [Fimbriimonadaceae bacterium]
MKSRIMYIERKVDGSTDPARLGRVTFSKTGRTLYYAGKSFTGLKGGDNANFIEVESGDKYWITGCKKKGYVGDAPIEIDEDVRDEYWDVIRKWPSRTIRDRL